MNLRVACDTSTIFLSRIGKWFARTCRGFWYDLSKVSWIRCLIVTVRNCSWFWNVYATMVCDVLLFMQIDVDINDICDLEVTLMYELLSFSI